MVNYGMGERQSCGPLKNSRRVAGGLQARRYTMFHPEQPLIVPQKTKQDPRIGPVAVMVAMENDLTLVRRALDISGRPTGRILMSKVFTTKQGSGDISVVGPVLGAPHAVMVLEKLVVLGAQKIVFLGWCGSVRKETFIGDFLIPDCGVIGEGTSRYYASGSAKKYSKPSPDIVRALKKTSGRQPVAFHIGPVWSTDAPYRETLQQIQSLKRDGVLAADMETSALFTVSRFRQVKAGALLVVSDQLVAPTWRPGFADPAFKRSRKTASAIIAQTCRELGLEYEGKKKP